MGSSTWVQDKIELGLDGELVVFKRANSPNWYFRVYVQQERKHYQKSLKTKNRADAIELAKRLYKEIQVKLAREEKVFTIPLGEAIGAYQEEEKIRERRGVIQNDWLKKKYMYLKNVFCHHFGEARLVNDISDSMISEYIDIRLKRCKRKETVKQEIVIIKHFYKSFLIKKGYVFRMPEFPEFRLKKGEQARREDTFSIYEWETLFRFMREWVKEKNVSKTRTAHKSYGKKENQQKLLNEWEWHMECHRRVLIRELVLIAANTGIRCPKEILSLTWADIRVEKHLLPGLYNSDKEVEQLISIIQIGLDQKTGARQVVGLAGSYFVRLKQHYRDKFGYEPQDADPIFLEMVGRRKGSVLDRYALYRIWKELMVSASLTRLDFSLYSLRGFYITQSILNGVDVTLIAKNCGNSPQTIFQHYEFVDMEKNISHLVKRRDVRSEATKEVEL